MEGNKLKITNAKTLKVELFPKSTEAPDKNQVEAKVCVYKTWNEDEHLILKISHLHFRQIISLYLENIEKVMPPTYYEHYLGKEIKFERVVFDDNDLPCYTLYFDRYVMTLSHASWMKICEFSNAIIEKMNQQSSIIFKAQFYVIPQ